MAVLLPLDQMTVAEKLRLMETIWADLSRNADALESPAWHEDVLREREELIDQGSNPSIDWDQAKSELLRELSENPDSR